MIEARKYQDRQRIIHFDKWGESAVAAISSWEVSSERRHRINFKHSIEINVGGKIGSEDFRVFQQNRPKAGIHFALP